MRSRWFPIFCVDQYPISIIGFDFAVALLVIFSAPVVVTLPNSTMRDAGRAGTPDGSFIALSAVCGLSGRLVHVHELIGRLGFPNRDGIDDRDQLLGLLLGVEVGAEPLTVRHWVWRKAEICQQLLVNRRRPVIGVDADVGYSGLAENELDRRLLRDQRKNWASYANVFEELARDLDFALWLQQQQPVGLLRDALGLGAGHWGDELEPALALARFVNLVLHAGFSEIDEPDQDQAGLPSLL